MYAPSVSISYNKYSYNYILYLYFLIFFMLEFRVSLTHPPTKKLIHLNFWSIFLWLSLGYTGGNVWEDCIEDIQQFASIIEPSVKWQRRDDIKGRHQSNVSGGCGWIF